MQSASVLNRHFFVTRPAWTPRFASSVQRTAQELEDIRQAELFVAELYKNNPLYITLEQLAKQQPRTIKIDTPERRAFRAKMVDELYGTGAPRKEHRVDIITGFAAAGKTTVLSEPIAQCHGAMVIDADPVKRRIPEYSVAVDIPGIPAANGIGASAVHVESNLIKDTVLERALGNGDNIVLNFLGRYIDTLFPFFKELREKHGYKVHYHYIHIPLLKALERAVNRFKQEGRFFPFRDILKIGYEPLDNYKIIRDKAVSDNVIDGYAFYDNDVPLGDPVKVIEDTTGGCLWPIQGTSKSK